MLAAGEALTPDDMVCLQVDHLSLPALELMPFVRRLEPHSELGRGARDLLLAWDGRLSEESAAAAVSEEFQLALYRKVFGARLGDDALQTYLGKGAHVVIPANGCIQRAASNLVAAVRGGRVDWFPPDNGSRSTWESVGDEALDATVESLAGRLGDDSRHWRWGDLHRISFSHPLGKVKPLDWLFSRGPYPVRDPNTVSQNSYHPLEPFDVTLPTASYRQVIDFADFNNSRSTIYGGQCGHPLRRHYNALTPGWLAGASHSMPWDREQVERATEAALDLEPTDSP